MKNGSPKNVANSSFIDYLKRPSLIFVVVFLVVLALYIQTLAPGVVGGDAGEHQLAVPLLGIPHTTGYPLYVLVGKVWTLLLPVGTMAWRMNLFSAVGGALAAGTTALVIYHLSDKSLLSKANAPFWAGAIIGGVALSFGLTLWQWSTIAGVRSYNVFFFALLTLEAIIWAKQRQTGQHQAAERTLRWLAITVGLSLAHHRTTVFYLPSLVGWIWWHDRNLIWQPKRWLTLALLALAPLTLYAFIYVRGVNNPPYTHEPIYDFASFWFLVGSGDSSGLFLSIDPAFLPARLTFIWNDILKQLSWPGVILAAIGFLLLAWRRKADFPFQLTLVLLLLWFTLDFEVVNLNEAPTWYLMPAYFIFAVWLGLGINGILALLLKYLGTISPNSTALLSVVPILITFIALAVLGFSLAQPNWQSQASVATAPFDDWRQLLRGTQAQRFVDSSLPHIKPDSIILGDWEQYTTIKYAQLIDQRRTDITVRNPLNRWPEKVTAAHHSNHPIYFARKTTDLIGTPFLTMAGPLIHLQPEPNFERPSNITIIEAKFEDQLELIGYRVAVIPQPTLIGQTVGDILQVFLVWQTPQKITWDYAISFRLLDQTGQEVYKRDATHPVLSSYPTSLWTPNEIVTDFYEFPLQPNYGPLTLHILPYRTESPGQWHNLTLNGSDPLQEGVFIGPFNP